jgi:serine/threonine-protein kinase
VARIIEPGLGQRFLAAERVMAESARGFEAGSDAGNTADYRALPNTVAVPTPPSLHDRSTLAVGRAISQAPLPVSGRYGKYELLEQVAIGGMGVVYKALDTVLNRVVALKMIRAGVLAQPAEVERFYLEARAAAHLQHPNIISILEIGQESGQHYFTMGFVAGGTLALKQDQYHSDPRAAVTLMAKISRAVHFAHEQGILHRDLKPSNILLEDDGEPLVSDFGLAKFLDSQVDMTKTGQQLGTPAYMAPEQTSTGAGKVTAQADVWSLGVILYELLTGTRPFTSLGSDLSHEVCTREPPRPCRLRADLGADLETIMLKCLEKEPQHRYPSAAALAEDLERWLRREPIAARPLRWPVRTWRKLRRRPLVGLAILVPILLGLTLAAAFLLHDPERWRRNLEQRLQDGQPAVLIAEDGGPAGYRWLFGEGQSRVSETNGEAFTLSSWELGVLELWRDPRISHYRFRAEVAHLSSNKGTEVGLYFAQSTLATEQGSSHCLCRLSFNDKENMPRFNPKHKGNQVGLRMMMLATTGPQTLSRPPLLHPPLGPTETRWRRLAVEVHPDEVRVYWEGKCFDQSSWAKLSRDEREDSKDDRCSFSPRQGLGLFVHQGAASFKNVVIEPLSDNK